MEALDEVNSGKYLVFCLNRETFGTRSKNPALSQPFLDSWQLGNSGHAGKLGNDGHAGKDGNAHKPGNDGNASKLEKGGNVG